MKGMKLNMNSNEKKGFIFIAVIIIAVIMIISIIIGNRNNKNLEEKNNTQIGVENNEENKYIVELEDGTKLNTSEDLLSVKKYNNLEISNIQFTQKDNNTELLADVKNVGNTKHETELVKIIVLGEDNEVISEIKTMIGDIKSGESMKLSASISTNVVNAKDIKIEAIK